MKSQNKIILTTLIVVILGLAGLLYASPYMAMNNIKSALDAKDADKLAQYVDFPVLRENLKAKMMSSFADKLPKSSDSSNPLGGGMGQMIGSMVVGAAVDNLVSPAGVMLMMQSGHFGPKLPKPEQTDSAPTSGDGNGSVDADKQDRSFSLSYQGFSKVRVYRKSDPSRAFIFHRDGLMGWKLSNVDM